MSVKKISERIVLGTAQFGIHYGITNLSGKPTKKEIFNILSIAWESGIRGFDTAPGYASEKVLGEFIIANGIQNDAKVMTKIPAINSLLNYHETIRSSVDNSLKHLGCPIDVLFLHNPADSIFLLEDTNIFELLLHNYPVSTLGVSVYEPDELDKLSSAQFELAFQFPYNVIDRRFEKVNIKEGRRYGRSIFLQGILASNIALRRSAPKPLNTIHRNYHNELINNQLNPIQFALSFVAKSKYIDKFLFGVEKESQLREILSMELIEKKQLSILDKFLVNIDSIWIDPRTWS